MNYLEAAALSSSFRTSSRPKKPLEVVIAGAGGFRITISVRKDLQTLYICKLYCPMILILSNRVVLSFFKLPLYGYLVSHFSSVAFANFSSCFYQANRCDSLFIVALLCEMLCQAFTFPLNDIVYTFAGW